MAHWQPLTPDQPNTFTVPERSTASRTHSSPPFSQFLFELINWHVQRGLWLLEVPSSPAEMLPTSLPYFWVFHTSDSPCKTPVLIRDLSLHRLQRFRKLLHECEMSRATKAGNLILERKKRKRAPVLRVCMFHPTRLFLMLITAIKNVIITRL